MLMAKKVSKAFAVNLFFQFLFHHVLDYGVANIRFKGVKGTDEG